MRRWMICCLVGWSMTSCLETELSLTGNDYKIIDSLYTQHRDSITPLLDSACVDFRDSVMQYWVDSIMQERQKEIEQLIRQ